ncbi:uncharacterized protein N0V89_007907 [Didymosphaeria variabile]|uniref:Uncharacterized protein n=1 Tax=Didymosphaeria variabile TaxID=1932322 RepID=A0A9W8XJR2_9PLEO|nr:uncharacterized protein N0V89_007907 [Didymosphaeria variabile]KAJ4352558.1 hypothetical protein N0V89_007907 [Didymosphaeria variabile]
MSAADKEIVRQTYIRVLGQDELMRKLEKQLSSPGEIPTATHLKVNPAGSEGSTSWLDLPCAWYPRASQAKNIPEFLRANGIIDIKLGPSQDYIDFTDIHPLFRFENCAIALSEDITRKAWAAMAPALALSTKWLTTPELQGFWHRLAFGELTTANGKTYLARSPIEDNLPLACSRFGEILMVLADKITFWWVPQVLDGGKVNGCHTNNIFDSIHILNKYLAAQIKSRSWYSSRDSYDYGGYIGISCEFLYHLLSPESSTRLDDCAMMRLQFQIAFTLCHELCHAVYAWRRLPNPEIYVFPSDAMAETGLSWGQNVLGAEVCIETHALDYMTGRTYKYLYSYPGLFYVVHDRWVDAWFRKDTWARIDEVVHRNLLRLPAAAGFSGPTFWIAHLFVGGLIRPVVYKDREIVWPGFAVGKVNAPPEGMSPEEWFAKVRKQDMKLAMAIGYKKEMFQEAEGRYAKAGHFLELSAQDVSSYSLF